MSRQARPQPSLFSPASSDRSTTRLLTWAPQDWPVAADWQPLLTRFWSSEAGRQLADFVQARLAAGATIYPATPLLALNLTPLQAVRVVIVGQDPYHGPGQAQGLAFSVPSGIRVPPSLRNIFKELAREQQSRLGAASPPPLPVDGSLEAWARQGVLLLNTCLTVEDGLPNSHAGKSWEALTTDIVDAVYALGGPVVFLLWGAQAQRLACRLQGLRAQPCLVLQANHPSPLSALRAPTPFIGCGHFEQVNAFLVKSGQPPVVW
jgi:uracil-DNA glycosylase